jgi:hypothetical protein
MEESWYVIQYNEVLDGRGSIPSRGKIVSYFTASKPALWPTQSPSQCVAESGVFPCE